MSYLHTTVLILCLAQLSQMRASVIEGSDRLLSECEGQIKLFTDSGEVRVFREVEKKTSLAVRSAVLEGCGCFGWLGTLRAIWCILGVSEFLGCLKPNYFQTHFLQMKEGAFWTHFL